MENCARCPLKSESLSWSSIFLIIFFVFVFYSSFLEKNVEPDVSFNSRFIFSEISDIKSKYADILSKMEEISLKLDSFEKQEV